MERVEAAGGRVINWNGYRILGVLATSRSIGMMLYLLALYIFPVGRHAQQHKAHTLLPDINCAEISTIIRSKYTVFHVGRFGKRTFDIF